MAHQSCPICLAEVQPNPRYSRYLCEVCASDPRSADGRRVSFYNVSLSGGFAGRYNDSGESYNGHECFVGGIRCRADEARFGGIVIQVEPTLQWEAAGASRFHDLVHAVPNPSLSTPTRSVVPLLAFFREPRHGLAILERSIQFSVSGIPHFTFESALAAPEGRGKASYTDLMIRGSDATIAIEAKYTEPRYETVAKWLGPEPTANRAAVLNGWLSIMRKSGNSAISLEDVRELPYQLIHRAASACAPEVRYRALVYLVFGSDPHACYVEDVQGLMRLLAPAGDLRAFVVNVSVTWSAAFSSLKKRWETGERELSPEVRQALLSRPLFTFGVPHVLYDSQSFPPAV